MKSKTLIILAVVTAVIVGLAALTQRKGAHTQPPAEQGKKLFEGLTSQLNNAASVTIQKGKDQATIARKADGWVMASRSDYPAEFEKVKEAIVSLADLKVVEAKTANPDYYAKLGVGDPAAPDATSKLVTVKDASGAVIASLIVGNMGQGAGSTPTMFVRKPGEAQSFLVEGRFSAEADPLTWMKRDMISVEKDRMKSVTITHAPADAKPAETVRVLRDSQSDPQFLLHNKPTDRELKYETVTDQVANGLSYLTFEDVKPATQIDFDSPPTAGPTPPEPPADPNSPDKKPDDKKDQPPPPPGPVTIEFRTFDGLVVTARMTTKDGKNWALFQAEFDPAAAQPEEKKDETKKEDEKKPPTPPAAKLKSADEVKKEVDDFNKRLSGWAFSLPEYRAKQIESHMTDMLKEPTPPATPPGPAGPRPQPPAPFAEPNGPVPLPPK